MAREPRYSQRELLEHIVELCDVTKDEIAGKSFRKFEADRNLVDATAYRLQAIGEACTKLDLAFKAAHSLPWIDIIRMRHILSHDYLALSKRTVFDTAASNLDEPAEACRGALRP